jgi:hypothetical protein
MPSNPLVFTAKTATKCELCGLWVNHYPSLKMKKDTQSSLIECYYLFVLPVADIKRPFFLSKYCRKKPPFLLIKNCVN